MSEPDRFGPRKNLLRFLAADMAARTGDQRAANAWYRAALLELKAQHGPLDVDTGYFGGEDESP